MYYVGEENLKCQFTKGKYYEKKYKGSNTPWVIDDQSIWRLLSSLGEDMQFLPPTEAGMYKCEMHFPNKILAEAFASWMCNAGEQSMWEAGGDMDNGLESINPSYDYKYGHIVFTEFSDDG